MRSLTYKLGVQEFSQHVEAKDGTGADREEEHSKCPGVQHAVNGVDPRAVVQKRVQAPAHLGSYRFTCTRHSSHPLKHDNPYRHWLYT